MSRSGRVLVPRHQAKLRPTDLADVVRRRGTETVPHRMAIQHPVWCAREAPAARPRLRGAGVGVPSCRDAVHPGVPSARAGAQSRSSAGQPGRIVCRQGGCPARRLGQRSSTGGP